MLEDCSQRRPFGPTYEAVLSLHGFPVVASPNDADVVVTESVQICQSMLAAGYTVIHFSSEHPRSGFDRPSVGLKAHPDYSHPDYSSRYHTVEALELLSLFRELSKIERREDVDTSHSSAASVFDSILAKSSLRRLEILVVDNHELNRASATYQFGDGNSLSVCGSYKKAADLLCSKPFDIALLDLLMPPESFTLSDKAFERVFGSEFPAGIFTALIAARVGVKDIHIITDASHHDHPATAMIDYISWGLRSPAGTHRALPSRARAPNRFREATAEAQIRSRIGPRRSRATPFLEQSAPRNRRVRN